MFVSFRLSVLCTCRVSILVQRAYGDDNDIDDDDNSRSAAGTQDTNSERAMLRLSEQGRVVAKVC